MITGILLLSLMTLSLSGTGLPIRTIGELKEAIKDPARKGQEFDVTGIVRSYHPNFFGAWMYSLHDGQSTCYVSEPSAAGKTRPAPHAFDFLDRIRVSGRLTVVENQLRAVFDSSEVILKGNPAKIPLLDSEAMTTARHGQFLRLRGRIRDATRDETDATYIHMTLYDSNGLTHLMVIEPPQFPSEYTTLIGAEVTATGICDNGRGGLHRHFGPHLVVSGTENIQVVARPDDFQTAPDLFSLSDTRPRQIAAAGFHQTSGVVLAVWDSNAFLLSTADKHLVRVRLLTDKLPRFGDNVRVLGLPATDSFQLNLIHASWERSSGQDKMIDSPIDIHAADLTTNEHGYPQLKIRHQGKTIRLTGIIRYIPNEKHGSTPIQLESDGQIIAVDASALPEVLPTLEIGCRISVTGICVLDMDDPRPESGMPANGRLFLVPRTSSDIVVHSRPSWWTPGRLLTLLGIFAAALFGVVGWNVSLNRRARAKGKELAAEQLAHVTSELKVNERTRLAVELHDALSQTLTGVSMQIDTAAGFAEGKMPAITKCLGLASRTVDACRMELRNTLWDLRSAALDEPSMDAAIRKTLCQNLAGIDLTVRFNVPRETFSDNTAHAVLRIIRELATNALRHGKATSLKIAGTIDNGNLLFSVRDNGCGFDPDLAPGIAQGHFGLQGIAERLERLNGEMKIESELGKGAKVTVVLPIPHSSE